MHPRVHDRIVLRFGCSPAVCQSRESAAWTGRYDEGRAAIAAGLELVAGLDAWYTARLCAVGLRLEADRCIVCEPAPRRS
jgi:hypothetical protein